MNPQILIGKIPFQPALPIEEADGGQSPTSLWSARRGALSNITRLEIPLLLDLNFTFAIKVLLMSGMELVSETLGPLIDVEMF